MDYPKSVPSIGLVNGKFVDENTATGTVGSLIPSEWGNAVTDELLAVISAAGLAPVENTNNQVLQALRALGLGPAWQNLAASRSFNTSYYNTTNRHIMIGVSGNTSAGGNGLLGLVNGLPVASSSTETGRTAGVNFIVPPGASYGVNAATTMTNMAWTELR